MLDDLKPALARIVQRQDATAEEMYAAVAAIMDGRCADAEIAALLTALHMKGEAVSELVGAARAMRDHATPIRCRTTALLDTCGTGGNSSRTFNISTAAAFVVAATGVKVAKHGNRGISSLSGSADVLEALGVNLQLSPEQVARCVEEAGIGFCFAPLLHGAMRHAAAVRKQLGFRTIFNLLGPLTNPAGATHQLLGTGSVEIAEKMAGALAELGRKRAIVVAGADRLGEVSLWGETVAFEVTNGHVTRRTWTAADFDLPECHVEDLQITGPQASADVIRRVFAGESGPARDIVIANAAAALIAAERTDRLSDAVQLATAALDSGNARKVCQRLVEFTRLNSSPTTDH